MAANDTLIIWGIRAAGFPSSNYPTYGTRGSHLVLNFDDTTEETCYFTGVLPKHYAGGSITAFHHYAAATATTGTAAWKGAFEQISDSNQDIDSDGFATAQNTSGSVPGTSGHVDILSIAFSAAQIDSVAVGEMFRYSVARDVATDNVSGDLQLIAVELRET